MDYSNQEQGISKEEAEHPEIVKEFVVTVRRRSMADEHLHQATDKSFKKLLILLHEGLADKKNRKRVLQAITGLPISSQKQLTQATTSVLIDELIGEDGNVSFAGKAIIQYTERLAQTRAGFNPWEIYPWDGPNVNLPDLPLFDTQRT